MDFPKKFAPISQDLQLQSDTAKLLQAVNRRHQEVGPLEAKLINRILQWLWFIDVYIDTYSRRL